MTTKSSKKTDEEYIAGVNRYLDEVQQLQAKKGPYYDTWLNRYRQAVESGKCGEDSRYVQGMKSFLSKAEKE
jgi:hypothetical protein